MRNEGVVEDGREIGRGRAGIGCGLRLAIGLAAMLIASGAAHGQATNSCAAAPTIGVGSWEYDLHPATNEGNSVGQCGETDTAPDVWYKFVAPSNGLLTVSTCGRTPDDTVLGIYLDCVTPLACNDDDALCGLQSSVFAVVPTGETRYIRMAEYNGGVHTGIIDVTFTASPPGWDEVADAGDLCNAAQVALGSGNLPEIRGNLGSGTDVDMFRIHICDPASFAASTVGGAGFDTQLWLFDLNCVGVSFSDDKDPTRQSSVTGQFVPAAGDYYLAVSAFDRDAFNSGAIQLWNDEPYNAERVPDGPGAVNPLAQWGGTATTFGVYSIFLNGATFVSDGLTVSIEAEDACLNASETQLVVNVNMSGAVQNIAGGQFFLQYDQTRLDFVSAVPGDAPFTTQVYSNVNEAMGEITYAVGVPTGTGTAADRTMVRLTFNLLGHFCNAPGLITVRPGILPSRLTDVNGASIVPAFENACAITADSLPPILTVPSNIVTNADAGLCTAVVAVGSATATDTCDTLPSISVVRSDAQPLGAPFPTGTTSVTWTATDTCGNSTSLVQTVTVDPFNTLAVNVELQGFVSPVAFQRCISFELTPAVFGPNVVVDQTLTFTGGVSGLVSVNVPCGAYTCITARDPLHTLRRTDIDDFGITGPNYVADFTSHGHPFSHPAYDALLGGNLNGDTFIDILDFGVYIGQLAAPSPGANSPCGTVGPHADVTGDGVVSTGDFTFIAINFIRFSELRCDGTLRPGAPRDGRMRQAAMPDEPLTAIGIDELAERGLWNLRFADLTGDGVIDSEDVGAYLGGALPVPLADVNRDRVVDKRDAELVIDNMDSRERITADADGDGVVTADDLAFVMEHIGETLD
ncbi:MAG: DVUA0089 family protein [Phycisphaerales bacterium]